MIKLIATDLDGTLLDENGNVNENFYTILKELKNKKVKFAAASGRQYSTLVKTFEKAKDDMIFVSENGTYILEEDKELYSNTLDRNLILELIKLTRTVDGCYAILSGKEFGYIEDRNKDLIEQVEKYYSKYKIVDDLTKVTDDVVKFTICDLKGSSENSYKVFNPKYGKDYQVVKSGLLWLAIMNKNVSKGSAIEVLQKKFNISKEETMVFGDYFNDVEMLKNAKFSYAMENAPDEVKKCANFIAPSNRNNGVLATIKDIVLSQ